MCFERWLTAAQYTHNVMYYASKKKKPKILFASFQCKVSNQDTAGFSLSVEKIWTPSSSHLFICEKHLKIYLN